MNYVLAKVKVKDEEGFRKLYTCKKKQVALVSTKDENGNHKAVKS